MKYLIFLGLILFGTNCFAQNISGSVQNNGGNHAATVFESQANGLARMRAAQGYYLKNLGLYLKDLEEARRLAYRNYIERIREWWKIQDEAKERSKVNNKNYIERRNAQLDMLEKMQTLKEREKILVEKGILPKPTPNIKFQNKNFKNYEEFKNSKERELMITLKSIERDLDEMEAEQKLKNAIKFEVDRRLIYRSFSSPIGFY